MQLDFLVIGGGSGGIACAKRAALHGAKCGIAESARWGGTCVNVGCVPKKMMWWSSTINEILHEAGHYGFEVPTVNFSWTKLKERRDANIKRLNGIYTSGLDKSGCVIFNSHATILKKQDDGLIRVSVAGDEVTARHVLIATGGQPMKLNIPGEEFAIDSDGFFALQSQPKKTAVCGAGYIAVELSGVLNGLGTEVHHFTRYSGPLRNFDQMLRETLVKDMTKDGVTFHSDCIPKSIKKNDGLLTLETESGGAFDGFDCVLLAAGRVPKTQGLGLETLGIALNKNHIKVDEFQNTNIEGIYALGDVCGKIELTPMAIAAGRRLADRLFGGMPDAKADYDLVPTVVFSHPPIGTIGMTEDQAVNAHGIENLNIYRSTSVNLYYNVFDIPPEEKPRIQMKLICLKQQGDKILGLHVIGMGADEMLQGFGVAIKMGATKSDFDRCVAIHPCAGEEFVTLPPWGLKKE